MNEQDQQTTTRDIKENTAGLPGKVDKNASIIPGTNPCITFVSKGLVVGGGPLLSGDIPLDLAGDRTFGNGTDHVCRSPWGMDPDRWQNRRPCFPLFTENCLSRGSTDSRPFLYNVANSYRLRHGW